MNPQHFDAWLYKGASLATIAITSSGKEGPEAFEESLKAYDKAIELDPQNATAWMFKGGALGNIAFHMAYNFKMFWPPKIRSDSSTNQFKHSIARWSWTLRVQMPGMERALL